MGVLTVGESLHSGLGPSSSERWLNCPGSVGLSEGLPDRTSSYSLEGTAAHFLAEEWRRSGLFAKDYVDCEIHIADRKGGHETIPVTQEMIDAVQSYLDYCDQFPGEVFTEVMVSYDAWVEGGFGTADDIRIADKICTVTDLKYGKGVQVYAEENSQLKLYALGVFQEYGHLYDIDKFQLNVCQPRLDHVDEWVITIEDLLTWAEDVVKPGAERVKEENAAIRAGKWCQFCRAKEGCKVRAEAVFLDTIEDFDNLDDVPEGVISTPAAFMTNVEVAQVLPRIDEIRSWCNDLEAYAMSEVQAGNKVGDYKLVEGRSNRAWKGEDDEIVKRLKANRMKVSQIFTKKLISPTQAEKILGKKHPLMAELVHKPPGKPKLAPGNDKRPAIVIDASEEFDNLDSEE